MKQDAQNQQDKKKGGLAGSLMMGAVGVAAGAAAVALADKGNQRKLQKAIDSIQSKSEELRDKTMKRLTEVEDRVNDASKTAKKSVKTAQRKVAKLSADKMGKKVSK